MRHLFRTRVEVLSGTSFMRNGSPVLQWVRVNDMFDPHLNIVGQMMCRLDLNFIRVGKDIPPAQEAGRAPDRVGVMMCNTTRYLKAGHRIRCLSGPIRGTFEIRAIPDEALDSTDVAHHLEISVIEVSQSLEQRFPDTEPEPGRY